MTKHTRTATSSPPSSASVENPWSPRIKRYRRRRRRRPLSSTSSSSSSSSAATFFALVAAVVVAASSSSSSVATVHAADRVVVVAAVPPPSLRKKRRAAAAEYGNGGNESSNVRRMERRQQHAAGMIGDSPGDDAPPSVNDAMVAAEGYIPSLFGGSAVVVQPEFLPRRGGSGGEKGGEESIHPWPVPEQPRSTMTTAVDVNSDSDPPPPAVSAMVAAEGYVPLPFLGGRSEGAGAAGVVVPPSRGGSDGYTNNKNNNNNDDNVGYEFREWLSAQRLAGGGKKGAHVASYRMPSPPEDLDVVSGRSVVLRPLGSGSGSGGDVDAVDGVASPPLVGDAAAAIGDGGGGGGAVVYYYDPAALTVRRSSLPSDAGGSTTTNNNNNNAVGGGALEAPMPELTLPDVVYDASGTPFGLESVHDGGRNDVYLEIGPRGAAWGDANGGGGGGRLVVAAANRWNSIRDELRGGGGTSSSSSSQDQLIVLFTVATMAVMVGALSARRLRSRNMLEECMHPDLDDDPDVGGGGSFSGSGVGRGRGGTRYDHNKKYDVDTGGSVASGGSALFDAASDYGTLLGGGRKGGYYGTNDVGGGGGGGGGAGGLHWRGDMEKFDV